MANTQKFRKTSILLGLVLLVAASAFLAACSTSKTIYPMKTSPQENKSLLQENLESVCGIPPYSCQEELSCEGSTITFEAYIMGSGNVFPDEHRFLIGDSLSTSAFISGVVVSNDTPSLYTSLKNAADNNESVKITGKIASFLAPTNNYCSRMITFTADAKDIVFN